MKLGLILLLIGLALGVAACATPASPTSVPAPSTPVITPPITVPVPTVSLPSDPYLAVYAKNGCFAGISDTLVLREEGQAELTDRKGTRIQKRLSPDEFQPLRKLFADPAFIRLQPAYQAAGADLCVYTISTALPDRVQRTITTMDAAPTPEILKSIIGEMERISKLVR